MHILKRPDALPNQHQHVAVDASSFVIRNIIQFSQHLFFHPNGNALDRHKIPSYRYIVHLFYGLSMLDKYKNTGWKKFYLIFGMCDESFTVNCTVTLPDDVDRGWFMFFVNLLNQIYWVFAATAGALLGYVIHFDTTGIEFVMTALFVVMFLNQWEESKDHLPALVGLICSAICLLIFGSSNFIVPSMIFIIVAFTAERRFSKKPEVAAK